MDEEFTDLEQTKNIFVMLERLKSQVELLVNTERNRTAEITRMLDSYQNTVNDKIRNLERDLDKRSTRLEETDSEMKRNIKEVTEKFEEALKTTNTAVGALKDKATGIGYILALLIALSPFLPKMIASILPSHHPTYAPGESTRAKPSYAPGYPP